jgi:hypothetical protein
VTPFGFGARLVLLAWVSLSLALVALTAVSALLSGQADPLSGTIWGVYVAALLSPATLGGSIVIGLLGWMWAGARRHRPSHSRR